MAKLIDLTGQTFGKLTVIEKIGARNGKVYWKCQCECGNICEKQGQYLRANKFTHCGCQTGKNLRDEKRSTNLIGQTFGRLTVIEKLTDRKHGNVVWRCQCSCGNIKDVPTNYLTNGHTTSCGCYFTETHGIDLTGKKFGRWTALYRDPKNHKKWICKCDCGNIRSVQGPALRDGISQSCGCINYSIGEKNIQELLDKNDISYIKEYTNSELNKKRFDFAILQDNSISRLIEYDGEQHYQEVNIFSTTLEQRQKRDKEKNQYALSHNIPLVRIPYWERDNITLEMLFSDEYLVKEEGE